MRNKDFERPSNVDHERGRKRKLDAQPEKAGFFHAGLTPELKESLVDYARLAAESARAEGRKAQQEHNEEKLSRREDRLQQLLNTAIDHYAYSLELFDAWKAQRAKGD